jgi:hypothetical protein
VKDELDAKRRARGAQKKTSYDGALLEIFFEGGGSRVILVSDCFFEFCDRLRIFLAKKCAPSEDTYQQDAAEWEMV